jgi:hypothetical protein
MPSTGAPRAGQVLADKSKSGEVDSFSLVNIDVVRPRLPSPTPSLWIPCADGFARSVSKWDCTGALSGIPAGTVPSDCSWCRFWAFFQTLISPAATTPSASPAKCGLACVDNAHRVMQRDSCRTTGTADCLSRCQQWANRNRRFGSAWERVLPYEHARVTFTRIVRTYSQCGSRQTSLPSPSAANPCTIRSDPIANCCGAVAKQQARPLCPPALSGIVLRARSGTRPGRALRVSLGSPAGTYFGGPLRCQPGCRCVAR